MELAKSYESQKEFGKARQVYLQLIQHTPKDIRILERLGALEKKLGNLKKSQEYFEQALKISPMFQWAQIELIKLHLNQQHD